MDFSAVKHAAIAPTMQPAPTLTLMPSPTASPSPTMTPTPMPPTPIPTSAPVVSAPAANGEVRLMPLGDSLTDGGPVSGGYRTKLWKRLVQEDGDKIDFVGSMFGGTIEMGDLNHEGHIGWTTDQLLGSVSGYISASQPDIVLLLIGTNDVINNVPAATITSNLSAIIGRIFAARPSTYVIVSSIPTLPNANGTIWSDYNNSIPGIVGQYSGQGRKIVFLNMANVLTSGDLIDGIHPSYGGYATMAAAWYPTVSIIYREYHH